MIIVADTSALFAAFDADQDEHEQAVSVMERETLIISPLVLTELDHLTRRDLGFNAAMAITDVLLARAIEGRYRLAELKHVDLSTAQSVRAKYEGLQLDLADAVGVALADKYKTDCIFTLDQRDFRAIEPLTSGLRSFRILPATANRSDQGRSPQYR